MSSLMEIMQGKKNYHGLTAVAQEQLDDAQRKLGLTFSYDYLEYVSSVGVASFSGHELTGICTSPRLDVIRVTEKYRKSMPAINPTWYVIEELNIDQITIWQDAEGKIYQVAPHAEPVKIAQSIADYINS